MSIEQRDVVDFIGTDEANNTVILTISDHLDWDDTENHLLLLQDKINTYLSFYESGEIYETYPQATGRQIIIDIIGKYPLHTMGENFLAEANKTIQDMGVKIQFIQFEFLRPQNGIK